MWLNWWGFASASDVKWLTGSDNKNKLLSVKYMIYVHHLSSNYAWSVWVTVQQLPKGIGGLFLQIKSRLLIKLLSTWGDRRVPEPRLKTAPLPVSVNKIAGSRQINRSSQCPWEKRVDMLDTGANTKPLLLKPTVKQPSQKPRCCATKKIQYFPLDHLKAPGTSRREMFDQQRNIRKNKNIMILR